MTSTDEEMLHALTSGMRGKHRFVQALAEAAARRITRRTIRSLQKLTDCLLTGDDTLLANLWDEICVQAQFDHFDAWAFYEETGKATVSGLVSDLTDHEKEALWLQTEAGWDWDYDTRDANARGPVDESEVVDFVWTEYILLEAGRWTNSRIRAYLDRAGSTD